MQSAKRPASSAAALPRQPRAQSRVSAGRVVARRRILAAAWGPAHGEDARRLRVFIDQLSGKIERDPTAPAIVKTGPRVGDRGRPSREAQASALRCG